MDRRSLGTLALLLTVSLASAAWALVPGGRLRHSDCLAEWRVTSHAVTPSRGTRTLECEDGDPSCDADGTQNGRCAFDVSVCTLQTDPRIPECRPPAALTSIRSLTAGLTPPPSMSRRGCGRATPLFATLRGRGRRSPSRRLQLQMTALAAGMRDVNRLFLRCMPSTVCPQPACPPNSSGPMEPNDLVLGFGGPGSDLDLGSTGLAHNLVPPDVTLHVCLDGCDAETNPRCDAKVITGPGTANGVSFGPPRPLLVSGVPMCLVTEYAAAATAVGSADLATGALEATLPLHLKVYLTAEPNICPRCVANRCQGGANDGGACNLDAALSEEVGDGPAPHGRPAFGRRNGRFGGGDGAGGRGRLLARRRLLAAVAQDSGDGVSEDCPPSASDAVATLPLAVPLTTGTSVLAPGGDGAPPCVAVPDDSPPSGSCACGAECTGDACASVEPDSATGALICIDARGGVSQTCCSDDTSRPCFSTPVTRTGRAEVPDPAWPDPRYPKFSSPVVAGTFCLGGTGSSPIDIATGLPGPAAILLPAHASWVAPLFDPCAGGGTPAPY